MKKICDSCQYYADQFGFCGVKRIRIGRILVGYCKDYGQRKDGVNGRKDSK